LSGWGCPIKVVFWAKLADCGQAAFGRPTKRADVPTQFRAFALQDIEILRLDLDAFRQCQCIFNIDAKVSDRVFNFGVAKQNLHRAQIASRLVNN
jgi:hypothetical protein